MKITRSELFQVVKEEIRKIKLFESINPSDINSIEKNSITMEEAYELYKKRIEQFREEEEPINYEDFKKEIEEENAEIDQESFTSWLEGKVPEDGGVDDNRN